MISPSFAHFRLSLPTQHRETLDALASKLMAVSKTKPPGPGCANWAAWIQRASPALTAAESQALASYAVAAAGSGAVSSTGSGSGGTSSLMSATQQMQETQMSFNLQYLQLQNSMQNDNRQFTMVGNIMKTKHNTAKNTINNIH